MNSIDVKGLAVYLVRRPARVPAVLRAGWRLRANQWWRRPPFLPWPDRRYLEFRMMTAMGSTARPMSAREIVDAALWSSRQRVGR